MSYRNEPALALDHTAAAAKNARAVCVFVNDQLDRPQAFLTGEALAEIARTTVANLTALARGEPFVEGSVVT